MFDDLNSSEDLFQQEQALAMLQELSGNTPEDIRRQRAHFRLSIKVSVILQSGDASNLRKFKAKGVTVDISQGGCSAVFAMAARVGNIYRLEFDKDKLALPLAFARCVRCRLIREDAFEAGFAFFTPITLPESVAVSEASNLAS